MYYNIRNLIDKKINVCIATRGYGKSLQEKERKILEERIKREEQMEYEDFEIGDRVGRFFGDVIEKATIIDIQEGLYLLKFDNEDYENLLCDNEKIFKILEEE